MVDANDMLASAPCDVMLAGTTGYHDVQHGLIIRLSKDATDEDPAVQIQSAIGVASRDCNRQM